MKVLIVGKKQNFNAEYFYYKAFATLGYNVKLVDQYEGVKHEFLMKYIMTRTTAFRSLLDRLPINSSLPRIIDKFSPNLILIFKGEFISDFLLYNLEKSYKLALYYTDSIRFPSLLRNRLHFFSVAFTAANSLEFYRKFGAKKVVTVPWACDPEFHRKINVSKDFGATFIGTFYPERYLKLRHIKGVNIFGGFWPPIVKHGPPLYGEKYIEMINKSVVNLNFHNRQDILADALNMRVFEVAGCGGFQITDDLPSISKYFPNKEIETFKNVKELSEKVKYYMDNPALAEEIGLRAQLKCYERYKYLDNAKLILSSV